jgi:hypothetical protein
VRADLISGLGFNPSAPNLALVKAAFDRDPSPEVRQRALLALSANAASAWGEEVVGQALRDPALCTGFGERAAAVVVALENLARAGEAPAVRRLGRRLGARTDLPPHVRSDLERLLRDGPPPGPALR